MLTRVENAELFDTAPRGKASVLLLDGKIGKVGSIDRTALEIRHVIAAGKIMVRDGELIERKNVLETTSRTIRLTGAKES